MKLSAIKPVTYLKAHTSEVLDEVRETRSPIVITRNGEAAAVVIDIRSYEATQDTLLLLKLLAQSQKDIDAGSVSSQADVERRFRNRPKR
ncbi:MAG: type II toxin-antitoxin system Phd/YefM family antitoxin [Bryobacteraceae bacterium]